MDWIQLHFLDNNLFMVVLGLLGYFFMEFKSRALSGAQWNFGFFVRDNWYNVGITAVAVIAYYQLFLPITKMEALALGLLPNLATDWLQDFIAKWKNKSPLKSE